MRRVGHRRVTRTFVLKSDALAWSRQVEQQIDKGDMVGDLSLLKVLALGELLERYERRILRRKRGNSERYKIRLLISQPLLLHQVSLYSPDFFECRITLARKQFGSGPAWSHI